MAYLEDTYEPNRTKELLGTAGLIGAVGASMYGATAKSAPKYAEAVALANKHGVFRRGAWKAASTAKLTSTFSKVALSRAAGFYFTALNVAWFAPLLYSGAKGVVNTVREVGRRAGRLELGGDFMDTRGAYTARQRALRAITSSRLATRAAIGGEAQLMHR